MIKLLGTGLTLFACITLAQRKISTYRTSTKVMSSLISSLRELSDSISFYKKPLPEIIGSLKNHEDDVFFKRVHHYISTDEAAPISKAWEKALEENLHLPKDALAPLSFLGKNIGSQPAEQEKENISFCIRELEEILKSTEELTQKNAKMVKSFGILSGILIVIILM